MVAVESKVKQVVTFDKEGVTVFEQRESPLSEEPREVKIDELDWDSFPIDSITMEVTSIEPVLSENNQGALSELRFEVARLERTEEPEKRPGKAVAGTENEFWEEVKRTTGIMRRDGEIALNGDKSAKDNLVDFVEFLFDEGYLSADELPIKSGYKWYLINTERQHQNGEPMFQEEKVTDGIYVETKYSRNDIKKKIQELAERFGE